MSNEGLATTSNELGNAIIYATELFNENFFDLEKTKKSFLESEYFDSWELVSHYLLPIKSILKRSVFDCQQY